MMTPLFAEVADTSMGWFTAAFVTSLLANLGQFALILHRILTEQRRGIVGEYEALLAKNERMTARHETEILALNRVVAHLGQRCNDCDVDMERMYGFMRLLHGVATRLSDGLEATGGEPESVPRMPPAPKRQYPNAEFMYRTAEQHIAAGRAADQAELGKTAPKEEPEKDEGADNR